MCHPRCAVDRHQQHDGPEAEDDLDLADKVQQFRRQAGLRPQALATAALVVPVLDVVGQRRETRAARNVCRIASTKMPVTTALNGSGVDPGRERGEQTAVDDRIRVKRGGKGRLAGRL